MKRVAILQSSYIPWKGYFDLINMVDEFIIYDDTQFTKRDWRNRNRIKTPNGTLLLTVPVQVKGRFKQKIRETEICDGLWAKKHRESIHHYYARAPHYEKESLWLYELYEQCMKEKYLWRVNYIFIQAIAERIGIKTKFSFSMDYKLIGDRNECLLNLCLQAGASEYISGPHAKSYLNTELFTYHGIIVRWMDYNGYPEYRQLFCPPFIHEVSIIDLIFNEGSKKAKQYMLNFKK